MPSLHEPQKQACRPKSEQPETWFQFVQSLEASLCQGAGPEPPGLLLWVGQHSGPAPREPR